MARILVVLLFSGKFMAENVTFPPRFVHGNFSLLPAQIPAV
jgi:hypothetical protein